MAPLTAPAAPPSTVRVERHSVAGKPVVVVRPARDGRWPVVYALPGLGEMNRGPRASANGWVEDYGLVEAMTAVLAGRLTSEDFQGLVTAPQLASYNARLAGGFGGLVIVCPATPSRYGAPFVRFLLDQVVPWAETNLPVLAGPANRGVDGLSMGGRHALRLGFAHPAAFRTVGTEQAAARGLISRLVRPARRDPAPLRHLHFNLVTSERDGFRPLVKRFADALVEQQGLERVRYHVALGRHDKRFARGPGVIDMLLFHDQILNRPAANDAGASPAE